MKLVGNNTDSPSGLSELQLSDSLNQYTIMITSRTKAALLMLMSTVSMMGGFGLLIILMILQPSDNVTPEGYAILILFMCVGIVTGFYYLNKMMEIMKSED